MALFASRTTDKTHRTLCVMVVEDDPVLSLALEDALTRDDFATVTICPTAACALEKLRVGEYDALVLDIHLAGSHEGWKVAELVDALGSTDTRIVFQTGAPRDIPERIAALGPVLEKPYDPADLVAILKDTSRPGLLKRIRRS